MPSLADYTKHINLYKNNLSVKSNRKDARAGSGWLKNLTTTTPITCLLLYFLIF
jgi:hypothetical protein